MDISNQSTEQKNIRDAFLLIENGSTTAVDM
jgi:hypothetical protein